MKTRSTFILTLNTSTLQPFALSVPDQIRVTAEAGYAGVELWVKDVIAYAQTGGVVADLKTVAEDAGVCIVNAIAMFPWTAANPAVRAEGLEQARVEMDMLTQIGCGAIAAPPAGAVAGLDLETIGTNFASLLALGRSMGVEPILEFWSHAPVLWTISDAAKVLEAASADSSVSDATMLVDLFHMYRGGSKVDDILSLAVTDSGRSTVGLAHINDYPLEPPRDVITDADRVMPGDGEGPVVPYVRALNRIGYSGPLSVELFCPDYGGLDAVETAREALAKTKKVCEMAADSGGPA